MLKVAELITKCIEGESAQISLDIRNDNIQGMRVGNPPMGDQEKKAESDRRLLSVLDIMEKMKAPTYGVDLPMLTNRCNYYKPLLYLFGHPQAPEDVSFFLNMDRFPESYKADKNKIYHLGRDIFDSIKEATARSIRLDSLADITKEEREAAVSLDPKDKWAKKHAIERQQIALQHQTGEASHEGDHEEFTVRSHKQKKTVGFEGEVVGPHTAALLSRAGGISYVGSSNP